MEVRKCNEHGCELEVEYVCRCTSPYTYSCELHFIKHCKTSRGTHTNESLFLQPFEGTKEAILTLFSKEMSKKDKIKKKLITFFSQNLSNSKSNLNEILDKLDLEIAEINDCCEKISNIQKISKFEQDPIINLLSFDPEMALEKAKTMIPTSSDSYNNAKLFYEANQDIGEKIESLIKEKLEISLESLFLNIEEQNRLSYIRNNEAEKFKDAIFDLKGDIKASAGELENYKQEIILQRENDKNFFVSQINEMRKKLEEQVMEKLSELQKKNDTLLIKIDEKDRIIDSQNSDLSGLTKSISDLIKNMKSFEEWKQKIELKTINEENMTKSQFKSLEERFEQQSKIIDEANHQLAEVKEFYTSLRDDAETFKDTFLELQGDFQNIAREHENCKQEEKLQRENDKNFLVNQINEIRKKLEEQIKLNSTEKLSEEIKGNISGLMREVEKTNKKIEDLKQEIEKNDTLLLKINKKAEEHDKIINSQNSDLTGLTKSISDLIENMKSFEAWKQEIERNKINGANMEKSQLKNLEERFEQQSKINDENNRHFAEAKEFITGLRDDAEKFKDATKEFENYKQEAKLQSQNDKNFLASQINEIKKGLEELAKLNSTEKLSKEIKGCISELMRRADKANEEIEALSKKLN